MFNLFLTVAGEMQLVRILLTGAVAARSSFTWMQSMQLKINDEIKSMWITYTVVTKASTGDNTELNLN